MDLNNVISIVELALGFGFVIFWHELGHFAAAKWAGVKVEQFAVGFGTAAVAWRKGIGFRVGSTRKEYEKRTNDYLAANASNELNASKFRELNTDDERTDFAGRALGLGETEYRLNWLPLGGYVKMLGQDDLNPNAQVSDPRSYNMQPIPKRMVIVSAGVVMNIILAAIGFFVLFLYGFNAPPPLVGLVAPGSPAQIAGVEVGDRILTLDGIEQHDFTKIIPNVALLGRNETVPLEVQRLDGEKKTLMICPEQAQGDNRGVLALGFSPQPRLAGFAKTVNITPEETDPKISIRDSFQLLPGDVVTHVKGTPVNPDTDFYVFDRALQTSNGNPFEITVQNSSGQSRQEMIQPRFMKPFAEESVRFAGMIPRAMAVSIQPESTALGKVLPGDAIVSITVVGLGDTSGNPSVETLTSTLHKAGDNGQDVDIVVLRDGKTIDVGSMKPSLTVKSADGHSGKGLGVGPAPDELHAVVGAVADKSAAFVAGIPQGAQIVSIDSQPVTTWFDVLRLMIASATSSTQPTTLPASSDHVVKIGFLASGVTSPDAAKVVPLTLSAADLDSLKSYRYTSYTDFGDLNFKRHTSNPLTAAKWGVQETRDLIIQFYLTIKRMTQGSVPASNLMGPLGIVQAGAKFANRGADWLIWFLAMISANLAVVNFLPIPIVDGGLFVFLVIEKLQGKPISPRTQSIAQVVGLALILSVFIFVTYQDIMR